MLEPIPAESRRVAIAVDHRGEASIAQVASNCGSRRLPAALGKIADGADGPGPPATAAAGRRTRQRGCGGVALHRVARPPRSVDERKPTHSVLRGCRPSTPIHALLDAPLPALVRSERAGERVGRRPIPQGRAAPFRRPAAVGTLGRPWSGCLVPQYGSGGPADHGLSVRRVRKKSATQPTSVVVGQ